MNIRSSVQPPQFEPVLPRLSTLCSLSGCRDFRPAKRAPHAVGRALRGGPDGTVLEPDSCKRSLSGAALYVTSRCGHGRWRGCSFLSMELLDTLGIDGWSMVGYSEDTNTTRSVPSRAHGGFCSSTTNTHPSWVRVCCYVVFGWSRSYFSITRRWSSSAFRMTSLKRRSRSSDEALLKKSSKLLFCSSRRRKMRLRNFILFVVVI